MPIRLDERLSAVASLVKGGSVADIGCDHGKLAYFLVSTDRAKKVVATDISEQSLKKARDLVLENGADELVDIRLGDGLAPIKSGEVDTVVIAGLGGDVISEIISRAHEDGKRFEGYILSPNTHPEKVRRTLMSVGQKIYFDSAVECAGKLYTVIASSEGEDSLSELQQAFGAFYKSDADFVCRAEKELNYTEELLASGAISDKLKKRTEMLKTALNDCKIER